MWWSCCPVSKSLSLCPGPCMHDSPLRVHMRERKSNLISGNFSLGTKRARAVIRFLSLSFVRSLSLKDRQAEKGEEGQSSSSWVRTFGYRIYRRGCWAKIWASTIERLFRFKYIRIFILLIEWTFLHQDSASIRISSGPVYFHRICLIIQLHKRSSRKSWTSFASVSLKARVADSRVQSP